MTNAEAYKMFKSVYPERDIYAYAKEIDGENCLVTADFPDGRFYFVVSQNCVSASYNSEEQAVKSVKTETKTFDEEWFNDNLDIIEQFIEKNYNDSLKGENDYISFSFDGTAIANPFLDEAGTASYNLEESIEHYGKDNVMGFLQECKDKLCADKGKTRKDNLIER